MPGTLYLVGTPIGNLSDFSERGKETLAVVDFIAAEDTRVSVKLLNRFGIKKPLVSYYEHNIRERGEEIAARITAGENCALITDAGMPCISDPGEDLVHLLSERGVDIKVVPGPSAFVSALALSGLPTGRFSFEGFLSMNKKGRKQHLQEIKDSPYTLIFYEAPHKLKSTLSDLLSTLGDRRIAIAREMTKIHEEVIRTTLSKAVDSYQDVSPRGEFVLIVEGAPRLQKNVHPEDGLELAKELIKQGFSKTEAAKEAAIKTGCKKSDIYRELL